MVEQAINIMVRESFIQQQSVITLSGKRVGEVYSEGEDTAIISSGQCLFSSQDELPFIGY